MTENNPKNYHIPFTLPDLSENEINRVIEVIRSNWITTGPMVKELEENITRYCQTKQTLCLNSATNCMKLLLKSLQIGEGDEIITTPYTFAATSNIIIQNGAKPVFVDIDPSDFNIDPQKISDAITSKTKAIIPVDFAGLPVKYNQIKEVLNQKKQLYNPKKESLQINFERPVLLSDSAHAFGAKYQNKPVGSQSDFHTFSFHATKNLTTSEGGALTLNLNNDNINQKIAETIKLYSLHGQNKDALAKLKAGNWHYDIVLPGEKCNMPDLCAAVGLEQLKRYNAEIIKKRKRVFQTYINAFKSDDRFVLPVENDHERNTSYHLFPLRIKHYNESMRNQLIQKLYQYNIYSNVHFIPIVMHSYYRSLGYDIKDYPQTYQCYQSEISLPFYGQMKDDEIDYVVNTIKSLI